MSTANNPLRPFGYDSEKAAAETDKAGPCACCGRRVPTNKPHSRVRVVDGGDRYARDVNDAGEGKGDMGWFPVGATCAKRLAKAGFVVLPWESTAE